MVLNYRGGMVDWTLRLPVEVVEEIEEMAVEWGATPPALVQAVVEARSLIRKEGETLLPPESAGKVTLRAKEIDRKRREEKGPVSVDWHKCRCEHGG